MPSKNFDRQHELEAIQARYADYEREGRHELWTLSNPGFARLVREKDDVLIQLLQASLGEHEGPVLDLGAGSGYLAGLARRSGVTHEWLGVEVDPAAVSAARSSYPWADFIVASADRLPMPDHSASAAVASVLFSSLPSREFEQAVAREIERVLRPGGWLIWYDLRYDNPRNRSVHGLSRHTIGELFPGWEFDLKPMSLIPPLARSLGRSTSLAYPALHALPFLRSHLIGRLRRRSP